MNRIFASVLGIILLLAVVFVGEKGKGAQRWLDFGVFRFQPSELMKLAVPMMLAWYFSERALPPRKRELLVAAILIAVPIGVISAYKHYSWFDQVGTFISMVGFSVPTFLTGTVLIVVFSVYLGWLPSIYDTTLVVDSFGSFWMQVKQMIMPVMVLALFNAAQISRFMRASMLDNLSQDYVRTARAKGMSEKVVVLLHVLRNSMIPVVTVIALSVPQVFGGAIITEQIFKVNGLGALLIIGIQGADVPLVQTLTFIFAVLIVVFNLIADVLYGILDPRIRYD